MIKHLDLFSGTGGFSLAARTVWRKDYKNIGFVEIDRFCQERIKQRFSKAKIHGDIKTYKPKTGSANLITGGFPCQPFSLAGLRKGKEDDRYLWPEMFRVIRTVRPQWVVAENVPGIIDLVLDEVLSDLEGAGYEAWPFIIPAVAVNACHKRNRLWIVAHAAGKRSGKMAVEWKPQQEDFNSGRKNSLIAYPTGPGSQRSKQRAPGHGEFAEGFTDENWYQAATTLCGVDDGLPHRMDRIKALGNAIVPQVAVEIFKNIKRFDDAVKQNYSR